MIRSDTLNWHDYGDYTEMTPPPSTVCSMDEDESKHIIVHETLPQNFSANEDELRQSIVNETLSQDYSADVEKLSSKEEDKAECTITEQKDAGNEVIYDVPNFNALNVFE